MSFDLSYVIVVLVVILLSMTLHEAMHAFTSYWLGDDTAKLSGRLTLNPFKHLDPFLSIALPLILALLHLPVFGGAKPVPFNPNRVRGGDFGAALVAVAGPLTNLVLAFLFFIIYVGLGLPPTTTLLGQFMEAAVFVNLGFFVFNILPIPPLDGSRLLYAIAPDGVRSVMMMIERQGIILVFIVILLFNQQLASLMGQMIGFFVRLFASPFGISVV